MRQLTTLPVRLGLYIFACLLIGGLFGSLFMFGPYVNRHRSFPPPQIDTPERRYNRFLLGGAMGVVLTTGAIWKIDARVRRRLREMDAEDAAPPRTTPDVVPPTQAERRARYQAKLPRPTFDEDKQE